ncbi:MAG: phosphate acetyltransferase [Corynebacterium sp.]|uniref:phosphate acetyltransferase n=1 Tax=Corynebacterium sp. TaxID=1720 RepID=UPI0026DAAF8A|nr:phosphate acetyltransferase [Corynebacterium sp.]MDO5029826.1 phosphate acetyltransferase [Corynebacterium sp.]
MSETNTNASTKNSAVLITSVDRADNLQDVITAMSEALGGARCLHTVGGPQGATVDQVVQDPESALDTIVAAVEADRARNDGAAILTGSGNLDFDFRISTVAGAGVIVVAAGKGCHEEAAKARIRLALSSAKQRHSEVLGVVVTGEEASDAAKSLQLDVPVIAIDDVEGLRETLGRDVPTIMTPQRFQWWLLQRAKADKRHIVLPEGNDDRILEAADYLLREDICELTILGDPDAMKSRAAELGYDIDAAHLWNPETSEYVEQFAEQFAEMRKAKGVTLEQARETMKDISYFATMMIHNGLVDGMVSGAAHTTAHTIRPALQIIKTKPSASTVSSLFLMVMDNSLWGFADCAVLPKPTPAQLGEIAVVSAETAASFGIDPRVALLSYSTGASGTGEDVDRVKEGLAKARELAPELAVDGPLQFDAAIDPSVAAKKMPESKVAGQATVFVFPDLDAGNIGYKIAQRCGGALAIGPILQGLNKPVNDLSRGATVPDIINTVAITAIQAGGN